jgi:hypothetical protein
VSLDVTLTAPGGRAVRGSGIFVREGGRTKEITREEWDEKFPGREPVVALAGEQSDVVYEANVTHNLNRMADAAGIYQVCWRPEELGLTKAGQLVPLLRAGLDYLRADPVFFRQYNPSNGWGTYEGFVEWVAAYLAACEANPDADVSVSR